MILSPRHSRIVFSRNPGEFGLDPRLKRSGVSALKICRADFVFSLEEFGNMTSVRHEMEFLPRAATLNSLDLSIDLSHVLR
jgi:hypothetical protein